MAKSIRCETHGLYYDPDTAHGCVKCLEAGPVGAYTSAAPSEPSSGGGFMKPVIILLVLGGVGWGGYTAFQSAASKGGEIFEEAKSEAAQMDPNPFRAEIEAVEALVYAGSPEIGQGTRIERAVLGLTQAMVTRGARVQGPVLARPITEFSARARRMENPGEPYDLAAVRADWERVRAQVFDRVDWFHR